MLYGALETHFKQYKRVSFNQLADLFHLSEIQREKGARDQVRVRVRVRVSVTKRISTFTIDKEKKKKKPKCDIECTCSECLLSVKY